MEKIYTYEDAEVTIVIPKNLDNFKNATEIFVQAVIRGGHEIGDFGKSGTIRK